MGNRSTFTSGGLGTGLGALTGQVDLGSAGLRRPRVLAAFLLAASWLLISSAPAADSGPGIIIYTTLDNGRDETAIAVPFVKAEQFALVTNVTTPDGRSIRVTNNMLKEIVRPPDLSRLTVVDEAGLQSVRARAQSLRDLQKRFPRAASALDGIAGELERTAQVFESGNVFVEGRVVPRADYDRQVAAARGRSIDITLNGRNYKGAKLSSVGDGKVSITHTGGVASVPLDSLSDEEIAQLNGTSTGPLIEKPKQVAPAPPTQPVAAASVAPVAKTTPESVAPSAPPATASAAEPASPAPTVTPPQSTSVTTPPVVQPPVTVAKTTISTANLRTLLRDCAVHVRTLQQGHAALTDLQAFPGGRFGAMKYDEAMQESRSLQARIDAAVSVQAPLLKKLATLGNSVPDDSRIPQELHRRLEQFADLRQDSVEELAGIQKLDGELTSLLAELDRVAPEEPSGGQAATGSAPVTPTQPSTVTGDRLVLPGRGPSPLLFIVAGLLAFAAAGASFLIRNRRERIIITPCPGCGADVGIDRATAGATLACPHCDHEFTVDEADKDHRPRKASAPGPLLYGGVATGSLLLLAGLIIELERATASPTEHSGYTLSDYPADLHFLREKAESGDPSAQYELGRFHDKGTDAFPADPREAALWYLTAAEAGDATAQLAIGTLYDMGLGIAPDPQEAERWLTAAAEQGVVEAQKILGVLYLGKGGLPYEPERSIAWMTRAAEQGDGEAMFHLSVAYHKGVEVAPDPEASERWLQRAVEADFGPAKEILRLRQANLEAQVDQLWRQVEDSMPRSSGFYTNPYTQNIPPQYR
jgi:hypothetical protein